MAAGISGRQREAITHPETAEGAGKDPCPVPGRGQVPQEGAKSQGKGHGAAGGLAYAAKNLVSLLLGRRGRLTIAVHRRKAIDLIGEAHAAGKGLVSSCTEIGLCLRTLKLLRKAFLGYGHNRRNGSPRLVLHNLSEEEHQRIWLSCTQTVYASLPQGQILPVPLIRGCILAPKAASTSHSTPMDRCIGAAEHGLHIRAA